MQKHASKERIFFTLIIAAALVIAGQAARYAYENHKLVQRLKEEEIYMLRDTYSYHANVNTIRAYFMVCEPVDDKVQLVEKLERLIKEKKVVQGAKNYYQGKLAEKFGYNGLCISVDFYKPSRFCPIGWQPDKGYSPVDYDDMIDNDLVSIVIPWYAESEDEHTYYFWRNNTRLYQIDSDVYRRQTQEDGSFILIPIENTKGDNCTVG